MLIDKEVVTILDKINTVSDNIFKIVDGKIIDTISGEVVVISEETVEKTVKFLLEILQILKEKESDK